MATAKTIGWAPIYSSVITGASLPVKCNGDLMTITFYVLGVNTISSGTAIMVPTKTGVSA